MFSQALRINPLLVIFALLLGGQVYGFIGAFLALPLAAIVRESVDYFRHNFRFESLGPAVRAPDPVPDALPPAAAARVPGVRRRAARRAPTTCPSCGTELGGPDAEAAAASTAPG